jgi:hypothetical protein
MTLTNMEMIFVLSYPELRDNEWIRAETLEQCKQRKLDTWKWWKARRKIRNGSIIFWYECHHVQEYTKCYCVVMTMIYLT